MLPIMIGAPDPHVYRNILFGLTNRIAIGSEAGSRSF